MHKVSMQPTKKKNGGDGGGGCSAITTAFSGTLPQCIMERQHLKTVFSLRKYYIT